MEYRQLGRSGLKVPALSFGTGTFGGIGAFQSFGTSGVEEATRLVLICLEAGLTLFDSADVYSAGLAEEVLGAAIRGQPRPQVSRLNTPLIVDIGPPVPEELLFKVVDTLEELARETGKSVPQIALNWVLQRPSVSSVIIGARNEAQLRDNLGAVGWQLTSGQAARLDAASATPPAYPYWHQRQFV